MKITISKSQWEEMGKKAGWMKKSDFDDFGTGEDRINDLVEEAIHNPQRFKEVLRENPDICNALSETLKGQQHGYRGPEVKDDAESLINNLRPSSQADF